MSSTLVFFNTIIISWLIICFVVKVNEIVHSKYDETNHRYAAQVLSIKDNKYNLFFLDGDTRDDVPESDMRSLTKKQREDPLVGKTFFDEGDYQIGRKKKSTDIEKGEFIVLARALGRSEISYWCERQHVDVHVQKDRDVIMYGRYSMIKMIKKFEQE